MEFTNNSNYVDNAGQPEKIPVIYLPTTIKLVDVQSRHASLRLKIKHVGYYTVPIDHKGAFKDHLMFFVKYEDAASLETYKTWAPWWWIYLSSGFTHIQPFILDRKPRSAIDNEGNESKVSTWIPLRLDGVSWNVEPITAGEKKKQPQLDYPSENFQLRLADGLPDDLRQRTAFRGANGMIQYCDNPFVINPDLLLENKYLVIYNNGATVPATPAKTRLMLSRSLPNFPSPPIGIGNENYALYPPQGQPFGFHADNNNNTEFNYQQQYHSPQMYRHENNFQPTRQMIPPPPMRTERPSVRDEIIKRQQLQEQQKRTRAKSLKSEDREKEPINPFEMQQRGVLFEQDSNLTLVDTLSDPEVQPFFSMVPEHTQSAMLTDFGCVPNGNLGFIHHSSDSSFAPTTFGAE